MFTKKNESFVLEQPRFIKHSNPIQIAAYYSTVNLICEIYGVPNPTVTWYKVVQKGKKSIDEEDLQLLSVNSQQYECFISFVFLSFIETVFCPFFFDTVLLFKMLMIVWQVNIDV